MKKIHTIILYSLIIVFVIPSCTILKRKYSSGYYTQWNSKHKKKSLNIAQQDTAVISSETVVSNETIPNPINNDNANYTASANKTPEIYIDKKKSFIDDKCDIIILKTGDEIQGKVTEITLTEIKYKKCTNLEGPTISIDKKDVFMIRYANGTKDIITIDDDSAKKKKEQNDYVSPNQKKQEKTKRKLNGLGLAGFICSVVGIAVLWFLSIYVGIPLGIVAIVLSIIGLAQKIKHPEKYKKGAFEILGLIFGVICLITAIIFVVLLG